MPGEPDPLYVRARGTGALLVARVHTITASMTALAFDLLAEL